MAAVDFVAVLLLVAAGFGLSVSACAEPVHTTADTTSAAKNPVRFENMERPNCNRQFIEFKPFIGSFPLMQQCFVSSTDAMSTLQPQQQEEYRALRQTISQRGTAKAWIFVTGMLGWGALTMATAALAQLPVATFLPLLVLAVTFEAIFSLHVGVERIGRYLQVFHEEPTGWEHTAMAFGRPLKGTGTDPLFVAHFLIAALLNIVPALLAEPVRLEIVVVGSVHLLFVVRVLLARHSASSQRSADLKRFEEMKTSGRAQ